MKKIREKMLKAAVLGSMSLGFVGQAFAQGTSGPTGPTGSQTVTLVDPLGGSETFASITASVISFLFYTIALPLCTIMVLVGAFQIMTAGGDPEKFSKGRKTIMYAAIGFVVAIISISVTDLIKSFLGQ